MQLGFSGSSRRSEKAADESAWIRKDITRAVASLRPFLARMQNDAALSVYARIDGRSLETIAERLGSEARLEELRDLLKWVVQLAMHWETRVRTERRVLRPVIDMKWQYLSGR